MRDTKSCKKVTWVCLFVCGVAAISCFPTGKPTIQDPEIRDEKQFPNGTVIGKYSYLDTEGNPIQVKYYADDASYGVELKSLKVVDASSEPNIGVYSKESSPLKVAVPHLANEILSTMKPIAKEKPREHYLYKNVNKMMNHYKPEKGSPDFDTYYQNELKEAKNCGSEKVRVYYDKERKIRNAIDNFEAVKYCEQF
ncbi:uncharacterized protein LOC142973115 isoform X2 [Anticarsia gemmatalis]|uniref:uncharacterized protein LOC142973115 isoform X2 n=1 Tax=Anticarsia gemmatalis TaxID=129554 RepID=UPI003F757391